VRIRAIISFLSASVFFLSAAAPAAAQDATVGVSYSVLRQYEVTAPVGFAVDVSKAVGSLGAGAMSVVGEFGLNRFSGEDFGGEDETQFSFMGGVRLSGPTSTGGITPFGQVLLGGLNSFDQTDFAVQPGGGVAFNLNPGTDLRVQIDLPISSADVNGSTGVRFNVGVVWTLGQ
jgi:hypothetical protein